MIRHLPIPVFKRLPVYPKGPIEPAGSAGTTLAMCSDSCRAATGRVEMWRGGSRSGLSVAAPFVWRCPSNLALAPFPHPAHR